MNPHMPSDEPDSFQVHSQVLSFSHQLSAMAGTCAAWRRQAAIAAACISQFSFCIPLQSGISRHLLMNLEKSGFGGLWRFIFKDNL